MAEVSVVTDLETADENVPLEKPKRAKKPRTEKQIKQFQDALASKKQKAEQRRLEKIKMLVEKGLMKEGIIDKVQNKNKPQIQEEEPDTDEEEEPDAKAEEESDNEPEIVVVKKSKSKSSKEKKPKKKIIYLEDKDPDSSDSSSDEEVEIKKVREKVFKSQRNKKSVAKNNTPAPEKKKVEFKQPINYFVD